MLPGGVIIPEYKDSVVAQAEDGFSSHRCPNCGRLIMMTKFTVWEGMPNPIIRIKCPRSRCNTMIELKIV